MTHQEIFDKVARHLLTQKVAARNKHGVCMYRGPGGTKCAVGVLIPDEYYSPEFEYFGVHGAFAIRTSSCNYSYAAKYKLLENILRAAGLSERDQDLLQALQAVHDEAEPRQWLSRLGDVALEHELNPHVLSEFA